MFELPTQPLSLLHRALSKTCTIAIAVGVTTTIISDREAFCDRVARGWHFVTARLLDVKSVALVVADARPAHTSPAALGSGGLHGWDRIDL